jgi:hypothetical protein
MTVPASTTVDPHASLPSTAARTSVSAPRRVEADRLWMTVLDRQTRAPLPSRGALEPPRQKAFGVETVLFTRFRALEFDLKPHLVRLHWFATPRAVCPAPGADPCRAVRRFCRQPAAQNCFTGFFSEDRLVQHVVRKSSGLVAWPLPDAIRGRTPDCVIPESDRTQSQGTRLRTHVLHLGPGEGASAYVTWQPFLDAMRELNYVPGRNLVVTRVSAQGAR